MIVYSNATVKVAEMHDDEAGAIPAVDVLRRLSFTRPVPGTLSSSFEALRIDLGQGPEAILAGMHSKTRQKVRKADGEGLGYRFADQPDPAAIEEFVDFYDRFAERKKLPHANRGKLEGLRRDGALDLSRVSEASGGVLGWHCHTRTPRRAGSLYCATIGTEHDQALAALVSRANCWHYFQDMSRFAGAGCAVYDFGPWYTDPGDQAKLNINYFKRGFGGQLVPLYSSEQAMTLKGLAAVYGRRALGWWRGYR